MLVVPAQTVGDRYWFSPPTPTPTAGSSTCSRGARSDWPEADGLGVLTDAQTEAIAQAPGLDFPDPVEPPADPLAAP